MDLYVNGVKLGTATRTAAFMNGYSNLTRVFMNGGAYFSGKVDEAGVWNRALSSSEVTQLYNNGSGLSYGAFSGGGLATSTPGSIIRQQQPGNLVYADSNAPQPQGVATIALTTSTSTHWSANYFSLPPTVSNPGTTFTTNYSYDADGNLTGTTMGATSTTYTYDYNNRMITSAGTGKDSISYTYDPAGNRLAQVDNGITTIYPSRFYSVTQSTVGTTTNATSTEYVYAGDALLATIDQAMTNGTPVGTSTVHFIHTDNLGSTQATTDMNGNLVQSFDYAPYGGVLASTGQGIKRQYIDQFADNSGLNYLNARYLNASQGQFTTEDPVFWGKQNLIDPQSFNAYSYSENNPIIKEDPSGKCPWCFFAAATFGAASGFAYQGYQNYQSTGMLFPGTLSDNVKSYGAATAAGAVTGFGVAYAGTLAAAYELSSILTFGVVGGTAGGLNFGATAGINAAVGLPTDYGRLAYDSSINALTAGALTFLPGVRGALPGTLSSALDFLNYAHAARWGAESAVNTSASMLGSGSYSYFGQGGGGFVGQLSNAVVSYANTSGANTSNSGFAAALNTINSYNNSLTMPGLFGSVGGVTTPSTKK